MSDFNFSIPTHSSRNMFGSFGGQNHHVFGVPVVTTPNFIPTGGRKEATIDDKKDATTKISTTHHMLLGFYNMMKNGEYTDFTIIVEDKRFEVHRMFLALRSPYFAAMFTTPMKESIEKEVIIEDVEKEVFELLLEFIYTDNVQNVDDYADKLILCADKYEMNDLGKFCGESLMKTLAVSNAARYLICVDLVRKYELKAKIISFIRLHLKDVLESEGWIEATKNFDLVTDVLRQLLTGKKPNSVDKPNDCGTITVRGIEWMVPFDKSDKLTYSSPNGIYSPEFKVELNGQMTSWKLCVQLYYHIDGNVRFNVTIKCIGLLLPPPCVCKWSVSQNSFRRTGNSVLMSWSAGRMEHTLMNDEKINSGSVFGNHSSYGSSQAPIKVSVELESSSVKENQAEHVLASLYRTKRHLDAKIVVGEEIFEAHKVVLSEQSEVFAEKFETDLPEYKIEDIRPAVFRELLCLMYMTRESPAADTVLLEILPSAIKYKLRDVLIRRCESNLIEKLQIFNAASFLSHAHEVKSPRLKYAALNIIVENISMVLSSEGWNSLKQHPCLVTEIIKAIHLL